jgi:membrane protein DedA with SNARE-associated domain
VAFGPAGVFLLALLDSAGVPLPAALDALLILVAVKTPDRALITAALATAGSLAGNITLFSVARSGGRRWMKVPDPEKPQKFRRWFERYGLVTVFVPAVVPFVPLPLKVFVISAGALHTRFSQFLSVILLARLVRYFGEAYLGMRLGEDGAKQFLSHNVGTLTVIAVAFACAIYIAIRFTDKRRQATIQ